MNRSRVTGDLASHGNIFVDIANDRVGIGTTIPTDKLDLKGDLKLEDSWGYGNHIKFHHTHNTLNLPSASLSNIARLPKISFGDRTSDSQLGVGDFRMYHDYYNMHMRYVGANGNLVIGNQSTAIQINGSNGSGSPQSSIYIPAGATEGVKLYQANTLRFETVGYGVTVHGTTETQELNVTGVSTFSDNISLPDDKKIQLGAGQDLQLYHNGSHSYIDNKTGNLYIRANTDSDVGGDIHIRAKAGENSLSCLDDGAVELYHNNTKTFQTTSFGAEVIFTSSGGDDIIFKVLHGNLSQGIGFGYNTILATGTNTNVNLDLKSKGTGVIKLITASNEIMLQATPNGAVDLYHNNVKKLETTSSGATVTGALNVTGDITVPTSMDSTDTDGVAIQRQWNTSTITAGNIYKCGYWSDGEGAVQLLISVRSITSSNSGTTTYIFQGGFRALDATGNSDGPSSTYHRRLMPLAVGSGHGDGPDDGDDSNAWEVLINQRTAYTYGVAIHVPSGRTNKNLQVTVTELNRGHDFTDQSSSAAYSSITVNATPLNPTQRSFLGTTYLRDNVKINLGNDDDLKLYHDASDSHIANTTGVFFIQNTGDLRIRVDNTDAAIHCVRNGAVELYHDNTKRLETTSSGVEIPQALFVGEKIDMPDHTSGTNGMILLGTGDDLYMYHDGTNSHLRNNTGTFNIRAGSFRLTDAAIQHVYLNANANGNDEIALYYDNSPKLTTTSSGVTVTGTLLADKLQVNDGEHVSLGNDHDLRLYFDGSNSAWNNQTGNSYFYGGGGNFYIRPVNAEQGVNIIANGAVELFHNGTKKFETTSSGADVTGRLMTDGVFVGDGGDNDVSVSVGANNDLRLFHDGSNSYIRERGTGSLYIDSNGNGVVLRGVQGEDSVVCNANGDVELYHDNAKKLETTSGGASITGDLSLNADDPTLNFIDTNNNNFRITANTGYLYFVDATANQTRATMNNAGTWSFNGQLNPGSDSTYDLGTNSVRWRNVYADNYYGSGEHLTRNVGAGSVYNSDLNTATSNAGVYRVNTGISNGHAGMTSFGTLFHANNVSDTGFQIYVNYNNGAAFLRGGNGAAVNGSGSMTTWGQIATSRHDFIPELNNTFDLGSSTKGWRNVYMNDLNLSNMTGNTNDVDGTQGSWTIQEGKDDLYIINRLNGKKFKIKMEEVS